MCITELVLRKCNTNCISTFKYVNDLNKSDKQLCKSTIVLFHVDLCRCYVRTDVLRTFTLHRQTPNNSNRKFIGSVGSVCYTLVVSVGIAWRLFRSLNMFKREKIDTEVLAVKEMVAEPKLSKEKTL